MYSKKGAILAIVFLSFHLICGAWGSVGHKIVAKIAYNQLTPALKDSLAKYLGHNSVEKASVWMDEVRSDSHYDYQKPWHYINIEKGDVYDSCGDSDIVWAIKKVVGELKERNKYPKDQIERDLKILIHLVGDLHQPLHVGYGVDEGGNKIQVFFAAGTSNLHKVWDTDIIESSIVRASTEWSKTSQYDIEDLVRIKHIDIVGWMNDSRSHLDQVYDFQGTDITPKYIKKNIPLIESQLLIGGLRLSQLLKDIFKAR